MKGMKIKRFLSLLLALVMSLSLSLGAPAFAMAEPVFVAIDGPGPDDGIKPLPITLYENPTINDRAMSHYTTDKFTSTPGNGRYIKIWFHNDSVQTAAVRLWHTDSFTPVKTLRVDAGKTDQVFYIGSDATAISYYVDIDIRNGYPVSGCLTVTQEDAMN